MTLKSDANLKGRLTDGLKNRRRNLVNFDPSSWKSENLHFDRTLLCKACKIGEKTQKSCFMALKSDAKFEETLILSSKYNMRNLLNFHPTLGYLKVSLRWVIFFLSISGLSYLSWHWIVMQKLNKPWPCGFKNCMRNWVNHSHKKRKDSLETRAACRWILILT